MSITQFNATYVHEEDRVMFRFNTSESHEYRLWFTRLVVRNLLGLIDQGTVAVLARDHPVEQAKAIAEFKQQAKAHNPQFTTFTPAKKFPMGAEPVLVHGMRLTVEQEKTALELVLPKGQIMTMNLTQEMLAQIRLLLQTIEQRAAWGLTAPLVQQALPHDGAKPLPLELDPSDKPTKLLH